MIGAAHQTGNRARPRERWLSSHVLFEENRHGGLADAALGYADHQFVERVLVRIDFCAVNLEKRERRAGGRSLVAVEERVLAADPVEIGAGHREDRLVKKGDLEGGLDVPTADCRS